MNPFTRTITFSVLSLFAALPSFAHEPSKKTSSSDEVVEVLRKNAAAFEHGDFEAADQLWAHHAEVTVFENGHANYGWEDYRDHHLKPELTEMKNVDYKLSDIKTRRSGNTAWATFKYTIKADYKGSRINSAGLGTAVLEKQNNGWKIVHWHTSAPRRPVQQPAKQ